jgi:hypothetical protein
MSQLFMQITAAIITFTLAIHLVAVSVQLGCAVSDGIRLRVMPDVPCLAALWQNIGIALALVGFLQRDTQLVIFGGLFLALRLMLQPLRAPSWDRTMEEPLLVLSSVSLLLLAMMHALPGFAD